MRVQRRRLPHYYETGTPLFVTFLLAGALPRNRFPLPRAENARAAFVALDRHVDLAAEAVIEVLRDPQDR